MATRPVFIAAGQRVEERAVAFEWHAGMSVQQKRKSIESLHCAAAAGGGGRLLEVSTKSPNSLGVCLSAMNLTLHPSGMPDMLVECAFQGSKVFAKGGPFVDLYSAVSRDAKRDARLTLSGPLVAFRFRGEDWPLEPKSAFYDWLYISALLQHRELAAHLAGYEAFTDIEFNPKKSLNTQARSCALYVVLANTGRLGEATASRAGFLQALRKAYPAEGQCCELGLFGTEHVRQSRGRVRGRRQSD